MVQKIFVTIRSSAMASCSDIVDVEVKRIQFFDESILDLYVTTTPRKFRIDRIVSFDFYTDQSGNLRYDMRCRCIEPIS